MRYSLLGIATPFQVQDRNRWTALQRGRDIEEGRHVALIEFL